MKILIQHTKISVGLFVAAILVVVFATTTFFVTRASAASTTQSGDGRLVTIHDRENEKVILTHATTVREALHEANMTLDDRDTIEPALDTQLVASDYTVNIYRARPVIVVDGALKEKIMTPFQSAEQIAADAGIQLHDEDKTTLKPSDDIVSDGAGLKLVIDRATAFSLTLYGTKTTSYTQAKTVGDMLVSKKITLGTNDTLSVSKDTPMSAGLNVEIWRNGTQVVTTQEDIPFDTQQVQDVDQVIGYKKIQTEGAVGKKTVSYQVTMQNGKEVGRTVIQSIVEVQPKTQIEVVGAKVDLPAGSHEDWMASAGIASSDYGYVNYIVGREGGWEPCKVQGGAINCGYSGSMGYGIVQATPGSKMASAGSDWRTNPITQLKWATGYAVGRYGSWKAAYEHWLSSHSW